MRAFFFGSLVIATISCGGSDTATSNDPGSSGSSTTGGTSGSTASGGATTAGHAGTQSVAGTSGSGGAGSSTAGGATAGGGSSQAGQASGEGGQPGGEGGQPGGEGGQPGGTAGQPGSGGEASGGSPDTGPEIVNDGIKNRWASPQIIRDGSKLHIYFAQGGGWNVPHAVFDETAPKKGWVSTGEALPNKNMSKQADPSVTWAPGAVHIDGKGWVLYYSSQVAGTQHMCIFRAHSATPEGPFVDTDGDPLVCPAAGKWAIDAYGVLDASGQPHLLVRYDKDGGINTMSINALSANGRSFIDPGAWHELTRNHPSSWEQPVMENGAIVRLPRPDGSKHWYVFYSARSYALDNYAIGYADCGEGINGPANGCDKKTPDGPWMKSMPGIGMYAPGTPTFYKSADGKETFMAVSGYRKPCDVENGKPTGDCASDATAKTPTHLQNQVMFTFKVKIGNNGAPTYDFVRLDY